MNKNVKTIKEFFNTLIGKIILILIALYLVTSIVPELLNANNDFAVTMGIGILVAIALSIYWFWEKIISWIQS